MFKNVRRNPARIRKSPRGRTSPLESMTPQGQALWAWEHMENAGSFKQAQTIGILGVNMRHTKKCKCDECFDKGIGAIEYWSGE